MSNKDYQLDPLVEGYLDYCRDVKRNTHRTMTDMRCSFRRIGRDLQGRDLCELKLRDVTRWLQRQRKRGMSESSLCKCISHLRGFLEYAMRIGRADRNILAGFTIKDPSARQAPDVLSLDQARRLVEACKKETAAQRRDRVIILILYGCGLRNSELCGLNIQDVNVERREILVHGKGDKQRVVPVPQMVFIELLAYIHEIARRRGPLFRTDAKKRRYSPRMVGEAVRTAAEDAGITKTVTPKTLRHSYASHLMDSGVDLAVISSLMGHRSPNETGVYLHAPKASLEQAVKKIDLSKIKGVE